MTNERQWSAKIASKLTKATRLHEESEKLLNSVAADINRLTHGEFGFVFQASDGLCINDIDGNNYKVTPPEIKKLLEHASDGQFFNSEEFLLQLECRGL